MQNNQEMNLSVQNVQNVQQMEMKKAHIASIIGPIPAGVEWDITDEVGSLRMANVSKKDEQKCPWLRGIVVDLENGVIVARSYGHTPIVIGEHVSMFTDSRTQKIRLSIKHEHSVVQQIDVGQHCQTDITPFFEGTLLRVYKWNGVVYHSTHRKIQSQHSRWGSSPSFEEIYKALNAPADNVLFPENVKSSPFVYNFILCHPELLMASHVPIKEHGYLVLVGIEKMWNPEQLPLSIHLGSLHTQPTLLPSQPLDYFPTHPLFFTSFPMNLSSANLFLRDGYWSLSAIADRRMFQVWSGEAILITVRDVRNNHIVSQVKVHSSGYDKRLTLRGFSSSLERQLYNLYNCSYPKLLREDYVSNFVEKFGQMQPFHAQTMQEKVEKEGFLSLDRFFTLNEKGESVPMLKHLPEAYFINKCLSRGFRFAVIWSCFFLSVPLCKQKQAITIYRNFYSDLLTLARSLVVTDESKMNETMKELVLSIPKEENEKDEKTKIKDMFFRVKQQEGKRLYSMIQWMDGIELK